jgi:hypothetical protein
MVLRWQLGVKVFRYRASLHGHWALLSLFMVLNKRVQFMNASDTIYETQLYEPYH